MTDEAARLWRIYQTNIASGRQFSLRDWGLPIGESQWSGLVSSEAASGREVVDALLARWEQQSGARAPGKEGAMSDEQKLVTLGLEMLDAANRRVDERLFGILDGGFPINFQHPRFLETAAHVVCSKSDNATTIRRLLSRPEIDLLLRDQFGRQPWNNAQYFGVEPDLVEFITAQTLDQANAQGILEQFHAEHKRYLAEWIHEEWFFHLARRNPGLLEPSEPS